ncbi:MAG: anhydro-N-acetylmuramic acid kinase [Candidatus Eisenbacteria bacterium]|nr:anhydro-N-acetylmuramic acid kinase [Candidatus Eisenbacteria bacterium]
MKAGPPDALATVRDYPARAEHLVVGLMTGTSADAVDAVLVRFRGLGLEATHEVLAYRETPLEAALRREVLEAAAARVIEPERLMRLDAALGERYAAAVFELLAGAGVDRDRVDAVGSHGQTVRHVPRHAGGGQALTLQLGSAAVLAERTGIPVVSDFRTRDTAAGGEGAPLVPLADWWLFRSAEESRALLNLGGMANLTWLPAGGGLERVVAFDTGPGNAVLDALVQLRSGGQQLHDEGGATAAEGEASEALLAELLEDPFFGLPPPRSTGREHFGEGYAVKLRDMGLSLGLEEEDVLATAVELTAASVADALQRFILPRGKVDACYASGGGVRNRTLMRALGRRLGGLAIRPLAELGVPPESKEALAFAFLAHQTLCGRPGNVVGATGAAQAVVLGRITPGALR